MKLVPIFVGDDPEKQGGLYAVHYGDDAPNEFRRLLNQWHDPEFLESFLMENLFDLHSIKAVPSSESIRETILEIMDEADELEDVLLDLAQAGIEKSGANLQHIFKPLDNRVYELTVLQKSKASVRSRMRPTPLLRVYAIRLAPNLYIITGGAIKLNHRMDERPHLAEELKKLEKVRQWLKETGVIEPEDLNENYEPE